MGSRGWGIGGDSHFPLSLKLVFVRIFGFIIDKFLGKRYANITLCAMVAKMVYKYKIAETTRLTRDNNPTIVEK